MGSLATLGQLKRNNGKSVEAYILKTQGCVLSGVDVIADLPNFRIDSTCAIASRSFMSDVLFAFEKSCIEDDIEFYSLVSRMYKKLIRCAFETEMKRIGRVTSNLWTAYAVTRDVPALRKFVERVWVCRHHRIDRHYMSNILEDACELLPSLIAREWGSELLVKKESAWVS